MKCIILAAGYATRLYPLTEKFPKPLLEVKGKPIIDWLIGDLDTIEKIDEFIVVSNHKFIGIFEKWAKKSSYRGNITVLDDGTISNENRLGAVRDIAFAIECCRVESDLIVIAGDNLTDFSLGGFVTYFERKGATCIMRHYEAEEEKLRRTGVIQIDEHDRVLDMQEKPREPKSNWAVPPFYIYQARDIGKIKEAVSNAECNVDAPGDFIAWLCRKTTVYAWQMPGRRYDIGNRESYEHIRQIYQGVWRSEI